MNPVGVLPSDAVWRRALRERDGEHFFERLDNTDGESYPEFVQRVLAGRFGYVRSG